MRFPIISVLNPFAAEVVGAVFVCAVAICGVSQECLAQHLYTVEAAAGTALISGKDANADIDGQSTRTLVRGLYWRLGGGFAATPPGRRYSLFINGSFMYDRSGMTAVAVREAVVSNPQNVSLLAATSGKARFYSAMLEPTLRFPASSCVRGYVFGGFGWLQRSLDFNGTSTQGSLLQPTSPGVFGTGGNSGAFDVGGGLDGELTRGGAGPRVFVEVRYLRGTGLNGGTALIPLSAGFRW
jgi:hypothetical protein